MSSRGTVKRKRIAGDCVQCQEEGASKLNLWQPVHGKRTPGRRILLYCDTLLNDTGLDNVNEVRTEMLYRVT